MPDFASKDIHGIKGHYKTPFISKQDIVDHFPNDILPPEYTRDRTPDCVHIRFYRKTSLHFTDFSIFMEGSVHRYEPMLNLI